MVGLAGWLTCCASAGSCPREGCDALNSRVGDGAGVSGVAGLIASESDVVANGCQECGFAAAPVAAWAHQGNEANTSVLRDETSGPALASVTAGSDGKYALALEPGNYWICSGIACFGASVVEGHTTTLNIKLINGISTGYLALPDVQSITKIAAIERPPT